MGNVGFFELILYFIFGMTYHYRYEIIILILLLYFIGRRFKIRFPVLVSFFIVVVVTAIVV